MVERGIRDAFRVEYRKGGEPGQTLEMGISSRDNSQPDTTRTPKDLRELLIYHHGKRYSHSNH
jgi:hypothetical protein